MSFESEGLPPEEWELLRRLSDLLPPMRAIAQRIEERVRAVRGNQSPHPAPEHDKSDPDKNPRQTFSSLL
jgi:hypothetical protein